MTPTTATFAFFSIKADQGRFYLSPTYSIPNTRYASNQLAFPFPTWEAALAAGEAYTKDVDTAISATADRRISPWEWFNDIS